MPACLPDCAQTRNLTSALTYGSGTMAIASPRIKAFEFSPTFAGFNTLMQPSASVNE